MTTLALEMSPPETPHRRAALLMLAGQLGFIAATQFHAGGDANDHHAIFATYAENAIWSAVHVAQFGALALFVAGLLEFFASSREAFGWAGRLGAAMAMVTLALYGVLQAIDGVALKQAVSVWHMASAAEEPARFAAAEAVRWTEWGLRSYHDYTMGLTLMLVAASAVRARMARPIAYLAVLAALAYAAQGWAAGTEGFTTPHSIAIVLGWLATLAWTAWLASSRRHGGVAASPASR